ncbi:MAG: nitrite reductase small subunit NirD [Pseudomonadota bacterium]
MNVMAGNWVAIGQLNDIPRLGSRRVIIGDLKLAIFRTSDDNIFALEDRCPHKNGPLSQGIIHDGCVTCPLHNWVIALDTGQAQGADEGQVQTFPMRVDGETLMLDVATLPALTGA